MTEHRCVRVAFVDDEAEIRLATAQSLTLAGLEAITFETGEAALTAIGSDFDGIVISDIRMPGIDGLELFRRLSERDPDLPVILISGHSDIATAVAAVQRGAYDFLAKPFQPDRLIASAKRALEKRRLVLENRRLRAQSGALLETGPLLGNSPAIDQLRRTIKQIANLDVDVLIEGETGTGKGLIASMLHDLSQRRARPMVTLDCGALPDVLVESELFGHVSGAFAGAHHLRTGRIEQANRSTLFLDEIETMPATVQQKLQRALETRQITPMGGNMPRSLDFRTVTASKLDLASFAQQGLFSAPLFYRLNGITLRVPPLRERRDDIPLLFSIFIGRSAERLKRDEPVLTPAIWRRFKDHDWPGNVRELRHFAENVVLGLDGAGYESLQIEGPSDLKSQMALYEAALIENSLSKARGDVRSAIAALNLPRKTFYDKVKRLGVDLAQFKNGER
jgi:two-component system, NtrC family, C4-dicarboxylate transport response regulator DctD